MIWNIVLGNLREASGELESLRDRIVAVMKSEPKWDNLEGFSEFAFFVSMEHAYHHVNWAWNCRHKDEQRAIKCAFADFYAWEKFPADFKEFWPAPSRCRGKAREPSNGRLYLMLPRIALDEAMFTIDGICCGIFKLLGEEIPEGFLKGRNPKTVEPVTEEDFKIEMRHLYSCMNCAWNERKVDLAGELSGSMTTIRRHSCYPRAFRRLWPGETSSN